jgi:NTE family protein
MNQDSGKRSALVLSGGGAFGAYEIGVIRALVEGKSPADARTPLDADVFVGTSVGSFNAAMLAMNDGGPREAIAHLEHIWRDEVADKGDGRGNGVYRIRGNPVNYLDPRIPGIPLEPLQRLFTDTTVLGKAAMPRLLHLLSLSEALIGRMEGLLDVSAFIDIDPFCHLIERSLEPAKMRKSGKVLRVMATGWESGDAQEFDFRRMTDEETRTAIRASAAIPGLFPPVKLWKETFVDGGVVQNTPIRPAIEESADEIHVVSLNPKMSQLPQDHLDNTLATFGRVYSAMMSANIDEDVETARWINDGIEVMERMEKEEDLHPAALGRFAKVAAVIYRKLIQTGKLPRALTIHRYFPNKSLGDAFGMLNFHASAIGSMIDEGYSDALNHNCQTNGCVLAHAQPRSTHSERVHATLVAFSGQT